MLNEVWGDVQPEVFIITIDDERDCAADRRIISPLGTQKGKK